GSLFAPNGLPNVDETQTGSNPTYDGLSYFQILDASLNPGAQFATPQCDCFLTNLISDGLAPGSTFYFRAVERRNTQGYSWMAFDALTLDGQQVAAPEPGSGLLLVGSLGLVAVLKARFARGQARRPVLPDDQLAL